MSDIESQKIEAFLSQTVFSPSSVCNTTSILDLTLDSGSFLDYAIEEVLTSLKFKDVIRSEKQFSAKLRLALHFAPRKAIDFDPSSSDSRTRLIEEYIEESFPSGDYSKTELARSVAVVLDSWDKSRKSGVRNHLDSLLRLQSYKCNHCHLEFNNQKRIKLEEKQINKPEEDHYKPYNDGQGVTELMSPQVDHKEAVSRFGSNKSKNLQVLCALCNSGKGDGSLVNPVNEFRYASMQIDQVPTAHRRKMFFNRIRIDDSKCSKCNSREKELTVRLKRSSGGYVLSNLQSICLDCSEGKFNN